MSRSDRRLTLRVMPAQAGIHPTSMDARLRGHDTNKVL
jgi:hypothetical protein